MTKIIETDYFQNKEPSALSMLHFECSSSTIRTQEEKLEHFDIETTIIMCKSDIKLVLTSNQL